MFKIENSFEVQRILTQDSDNETSQQPKNGKQIVKSVWEFFRPAVITCAIILFVTQVLVMFAVVPTESMSPLIAPNSYIIANRCAYLGNAEPKRGDVVIFKNNQTAAPLLVKRVIGVGGDTIMVRGGIVYVNNEPLDESEYVLGETLPQSHGSCYDVPEGYVMLLGDNRMNSFDSRGWDDPYVAVSEICGRVFMCIDFNAGGNGVTFVTNPY